MRPIDEDLQLVRKAQAGDRASFRELYDKYKYIIFNYLYRTLCNDGPAAEELMQEVFLKAYENIRKFKPSGRFFSWLYTIARNLAVTEIRRRDVRKNVSLESPLGNEEGLSLKDVIESKDFDANAIIENSEMRSRIEKIMAALPDNFRGVITLCVIQGLSYEEAAKILKTTRSGVAITLSRARKKFIELLKNGKRVTK